MVNCNWVKAKTVPMGTTTILFRCWKPKTTVDIMMRQIMRVTNPFCVSKPYEVNALWWRRKRRHTKCDGDDETVPDNKGAALNYHTYIEDHIFGAIQVRPLTCNFEATWKGSIRQSKNRQRVNLWDKSRQWSLFTTSWANMCIGAV